MAPSAKKDCPLPTAGEFTHAPSANVPSEVEKENDMEEKRLIELYMELTGATESQGRMVYMYLERAAAARAASTGPDQSQSDTDRQSS